MAYDQREIRHKLRDAISISWRPALAPVRVSQQSFDAPTVIGSP
jgi:hypothetical protein